MEKVNKRKYFVRGCRSKQSNGYGLWDGAYVFCYDLKNEIASTGIYDNNRRNISKKYDFDQGYKKYMDLLDMGWTIMDKYDISITSGVQMDDII